QKQQSSWQMLFIAFCPERDPACPTGANLSCLALISSVLPIPKNLRHQAVSVRTIRLVIVTANECLGFLPRFLIVELARGGLHEVAGRPGERAGDAAVQRQLRTSNRIDHHPG